MVPGCLTYQGPGVHKCAEGRGGCKQEGCIPIPKYLGTKVLHRTLLALAIPHRPIPFDRALLSSYGTLFRASVGPVTLGTECSQYTLVRQYPRMPCFFRAVCLFRLCSSLPSPGPLSAEGSLLWVAP